MKKMIAMLLMVTALTLSLAGCGDKRPADDIVPESSQSQNVESDAAKADEATMTGIVNRVENPLVVLDDKDQYLKFNVDGVSLDDIKEGDEVEITYTGTLSEDSADLVAKSVIKIVKR
ncbi:hypothetical protein [Anaerotignum sp.]|uniref:hypothetical protein n=1 Tax=Anaerotignum sp. TaxID=2039241 RepID=UPI0028A8794E|nr:hypothetical protein [Anaerotignum sp.]